MKLVKYDYVPFCERDCKHYNTKLFELITYTNIISITNLKNKNITQILSFSYSSSDTKSPNRNPLIILNMMRYKCKFYIIRNHRFISKSVFDKNSEI